MKEISELSEFTAWAKKSPEKTPAAIQDLNLSKQTKLINSKKFPDSIFLSCDMSASVAGHIVKSGGVVIPDLKGFSFQVHRSELYSVDDLFDGFDINDPKGYEQTYDFKVYKEYCCQGKSPKSINTSLARRLHDHSITDALEEELKGRNVVAIMGGHGMERQDPFYAKVAKVSRQLTKAKFLMVSGGGPVQWRPRILVLTSLPGKKMSSMRQSRSSRRDPIVGGRERSMPIPIGFIVHGE